ncbi:MAG TPA: GNAT family N-acetyltransferase [Usitatibacter sp.]|jgi:putative acetyltransferase
MKLRVRAETIDQDEAVVLVKELDAHLEALYPPESRHGLNLEALRASNVRFVIARDEAGKAHGCGAIMFKDGFAELKRMYTRPGSRGNGVGATIVAFLEQQARDRGYTIVRLETGVKQLEALSFYEGLGYARRGVFAGYKPDPLSIFMEKRLAG